MVSARYSRPARAQGLPQWLLRADFVTKFGTLRLSVARTRKRGFLPQVVTKFQRRADEVSRSRLLCVHTHRSLTGIVIVRDGIHSEIGIESTRVVQERPEASRSAD